MLMALCSFVGANAAINQANNYLEVKAKDFPTAKQGQTVEVLLSMKNATKEIINWQTTLANLPEGVTLVSVAATDRWADEIQVTELTLFSETENAVAVGEGAVAKITFNVASTVAEGEYDIQLTKIVMTASDGTSIAQENSKTFKLKVEAGETGAKGDLTGDGEVNAADVQALLNIIAAEEFNPAADLNGDGVVNAADVQALLNIIAALA